MEYDEFEKPEDLGIIGDRRVNSDDIRFAKYILYGGFILIASLALAYFSRLSNYVGNESILKSDLQKTKIERGYELKEGAKSLEMKVLEKRD